MNFIDRREQAGSHTTNLRGLSILTTLGATRRSRSRINAIVLHQMGFSRNSAANSFDRVIAHFAILLDGTVLHLRDYEAVLNDAYGGHGVELEFEGDFPSHGTMLPTGAQVLAGRELVSKIVSDLGTIRGIYAHRHFNPHGRAYCPGPHIWKNIAEYAANTFSLRMSPPHSRGEIPAEWLGENYRILS